MLREKTKAFVYLLVFSLIVSLFVCYGICEAKKGDTVRIGTIFPLSGPNALNGQDTFDGVDIAREMINEKGGINGNKVEYIVADAPDSNAATQEADRLITQEKVEAIIGTQSSSFSYAASAVAERKKVFYWEVEGISDDITNRGFKYIFRPTFCAEYMAKQMIGFVNDVVATKMGKDIKDLRIALVQEDGGFGTSTANNLRKYAKEYGISFVVDLSYSAKSAELNSLVIKLKSKNPDVLLAVSYVNDAILLTKTSLELGFEPKVTIGTTAGHGTLDFINALGEKAEGIFAAGIPNAVNPDKIKPEQKELYNELVRRYKEKRGKEPSVNVINGFNGAYIFFTEVLPNAKEMKADAIKKAALEVSLNEGDTILGYGVKFAGPDESNAGQNVRSFAAVMQWQGKKLYTVYPNIIAIKEPKL
jgi:branched-chain amino acid transport system substrate-binding protein